MGTWLKLLEGYERNILESFASSDFTAKKVIIGIGGLSGTGKDTLALSLQRLFKERLSLSLPISGAGETLRQLARQNGFRESDLDIYMKKITDENLAEDLDKRIEQETLRKALTKGGILVGRMAPFAIGDWGFTIWLTADRKTIAKRVVSDPDRPEYEMNEREILKKLEDRDEVDYKRLESVYSVSIKKLVLRVNLLLETTRFSIDQLVELAYSKAVSSFRELDIL